MQIRSLDIPFSTLFWNLTSWFWQMVSPDLGCLPRSIHSISLQGSFGATFKALWHLLPSLPISVPCLPDLLLVPKGRCSRSLNGGMSSKIHPSNSTCWTWWPRCFVHLVQIHLSSSIHNKVVGTVYIIMSLFTLYSVLASLPLPYVSVCRTVDPHLADEEIRGGLRLEGGGDHAATAAKTIINEMPPQTETPKLCYSDAHIFLSHWLNAK